MKFFGFVDEFFKYYEVVYDVGNDLGYGGEFNFVLKWDDVILFR